jgi:tetratricopeptide (TPR) repeat protein/predicted aspartyl protease
MRSRLVSAALALASFALFATPAAAKSSCTLSKLAELPVTLSDERPTIPVAINGKDAVVFIDTGAFFSTLTPEAVARYGLRKSGLPPGLRVTGIGGDANMSAATAKAFTFAGVPFHNVDFLVSEKGDSSGVAGMIGQNLIGKVDVEYDLANGVVRLFEPKGCGDTALAYWATEGYSMVPLVVSDDPLGGATAVVGVNGIKIKAEFDTGSPTSMISTEAAARAGVKSPAAASHGYSEGVGLRSYMREWIGPVEDFKLGDEEIKHTQLRFGDMKMDDDEDMLIGLDFFMSHRVFVSNSQHKLYFTYNGGPVFSTVLADAGDAKPAISTTSPPAAAAVDAAMDAKSLARRAAAFRQRHDYTHAIDDLTKAMALEPKTMAYVRDRGLVEFGADKPDAATADFNAALALAPDDTGVLMARAVLERWRDHGELARKDLDAVDHLAPDAADLRLVLGQAYSDGGFYDQAIVQLDRWIAAHPKGDDLSEALSSRCRVRAYANQAIDKALADCNAALRLRPGSPQVLANRGLAWLRAGDFAKAAADFKASTKVMPDNAWALYGQGLATLKMGRKDDGEADIKAAAALDPNLPEQAKAMKLEP